MCRTIYTTFAVIACVFFFGCSTMQYLDGSSSEDMEQFRASKGELWNEVKKLKQDNEASRNVIREKQGEINRLSAQMANLKEGVEAAKKETEDLKKEIQKIEEAKQIDVVKSESEDKQAKDQTAPVTEKRIDAKLLKIKVLSGNGKISSAKALSAKLTELGYRVENVGMAPRSDFKTNTVYYAPEYQNEAKHMAAQLGSDAMCRPLTWSSAFHIIVVSGS